MSYSTGGRVIVRNYVPIHFTDVGKVDSPERYLDKTKELLDELGVSWGFAFGTALGLYREKGFIPHDSDIDVMILADDVDADAIFSKFKEHYSVVRTVTKDGRYHQIAYQDDNLFIIDLCFFYKEGENHTSFCEGGFWKDSVDTIGGFKLFDTDFGQYPLPEKIEDYLVARYGGDWQTPKYGKRCCSIKGT